MSRQRDSGIRIEADMKLERFEDTTCVQTVTVSSQSDGTLMLACAGKLPKTSWKQLLGLRSHLHAIVGLTDQNLVVTNDGKILLRVMQSPGRQPKVAIHWWAVARQILFGSK